MPMKQLLLDVRDGNVRVADTPAPTVKENTVLVETLYSVVSAGTERMLASFGNKNLLQKAMERPDQVQKVLEKISTDGIWTAVEAAFTKLEEPMPMGYSGMGIVRACGKGIADIKPGDLVAMAGQAYHAEVNRVGKNLVAKIPEGCPDPRQAALCALGGIALQGIHQAGVVAGETVAVIGLGLLGHIAARILNAYGCDVIGYDIADKTLPGTRLKAFVRSDDENAMDTTRALTMGRGVDKIIITAAADSNGPMDLAAAIARDRGTICMIGVTQMQIDRRPYYQKELTFTIARSYGPGRYEVDYEEKGVDLPIGHVRFSEGRNIEEFVRLIAGGRVSFTDLITHEIAFDKAPSAYEMITTNPNKERYIAILLKYEQNTAKWAPKVQHAPKAEKAGAAGDQIAIGLIGAGGFVRSTILPTMKANGHYTFRGMATTGGVSGAQTGEMFPFAYATNDYRELLKDEQISLIVVSTQHNSHAKFVVEALEAGKHVYCEKPLCLTLEELDAIEAAYQKGKAHLFCGLNRRHSPLIEDIRKKLTTDKVPAIYDYIMNAGFIPENHWTQDESAGGGRIIGEACHIVDLIQYLDGSALSHLTLSFADNPGYPKGDNALIQLRFVSGAIANIVYTSMGSKKYPKEQLRVFSNGSVCEMNNYIGLTICGNVHARTIKLKQDKGIANEYAFIYDVIGGRRQNDAIAGAFAGHRMLIEALRQGRSQ